jgi:hypothetical protein
LADFGVERHTLVTEKITQVFHHSSAAVTQGPATRAHLSRVRTQLLRRFRESISPIQGEFRDSPPTQLRGRQGASFALVPRQIPMEESSGAHFPDLEVQHFWRTHSGFPSEHQIRFRETLPTNFPVDQGNHFEIHLSRFRWWNH